MALKFSLPNHSSFLRTSTRTTNRSRPKTMVQAFAKTTTGIPPVTTRNHPNFYQVLRVQQSASSIEIKTAYRNLVKHFHPDVARSGSSSNFIEIQKAYETLYDPTSRERYDLSIQGEDNRFRYQNEVVSNTNGGYGYGASLKTRRWETDQCC